GVGGHIGDSTNYHFDSRGSGDRPTFKYRLGSSSKKRSLIGKLYLAQEDYPESLSDENPPEVFPAPPAVTIAPSKYKANIKQEKVLG
ncbi:Hypothetical predicted protein, partial [Paramuricea clavata]